MTPMARAVATLDPQRAPKIMQEMTVTMASPPHQWRTQQLAALMRYREVPPWTMNWAAMTKKGMAMRGKVSRELYMTSGTICRGAGEKKAIMMKAVTPRTKAMGSPRQSKPKKTKKRNRTVIRTLHPCSVPGTLHPGSVHGSP